MNFSLEPTAIEKIKILGSVLELPAKQHCQSSPFTYNIGQIGWIGSLAGSSKMAPLIFILIAMGANHSFEVKNTEILVPAFFKHNNSSLATVLQLISSVIPYLVRDCKDLSATVKSTSCEAIQMLKRTSGASTHDIMF